MKFLPAALVGASLVTVSLLAASPAVAAGNAVDPGDSMYSISCDSDLTGYQLFSVESTTAASTPIGTGSLSEGYPCAGQPAYNPATGVSYYIQWGEEPETLASIDVTTGVSTTIGGFYYDNGEFPEYIDPDAIAIGADGTAYLLGNNTLWSLNLATAWVEPIGESVQAYAFAADPATGKFYAIESGNEIWEIDVTTGAATSLGTITFPNESYRTYSLQFDEAGTFWVEVDYYDEGLEEYWASLWSFTLPTIATPVLSGTFTLDGAPYYHEALLIIPGTPEVVLADTGVDASALPFVAGIAGLLVAAGITTTIIARRRRA